MSPLYIYVRMTNCLGYRICDRQNLKKPVCGLVCKIMFGTDVEEICHYSHENSKENF